eukprot:TRINITY_DN40656_c0_g1_i1.p1 TRINITY_DN40656_c0_g1~~TRINITY_DN40656_c0_g1_i1.p1  ORF type:complete len:303 (+),score=34.35 TRINITY_DN40656_c0_g1_i1:35-943(+)
MPQARPPWQRALWSAQPYPDDHVPPRFLEGLRTNVQLPQYSYGKLVTASTVVTLQVSLTVLYCIVFAYAHSGEATPGAVLSCCVTVAVCCAGGRAATSAAPSVRAAARVLCDWFLFAGLLLFLSPVLATLTRPWAADTLTAVCLVLLTAHVVLTDFSWLTAQTDRRSASGVASLSAATFAGVLLTSRLDGAAAFPLLVLQVLLFGVAQEFQRSLFTRAPEVFTAMTWLLVGTCAALLPGISPLLAVVYVVGIAALTLVVPLWFLREHQRLKLQISGPWDEARPTNSLAAAEWATAGLLGRKS